MFKNFIEQLKVKKFLKQYEMSDKRYLIELANMLDKAEVDGSGLIKISEEMCRQMSMQLRKIGNKMVVR